MESYRRIPRILHINKITYPEFPFFLRHRWRRRKQQTAQKINIIHSFHYLNPNYILYHTNKCCYYCYDCDIYKQWNKLKKICGVSAFIRFLHNACGFHRQSFFFLFRVGSIGKRGKNKFSWNLENKLYFLSAAICCFIRKPICVWRCMISFVININWKLDERTPHTSPAPPSIFIHSLALTLPSISCMNREQSAGVYKR